MADIEKVTNKLKELTRHENARLVNCGNAAIFAAIYILKKVNAKPFILVPDQGGWISFKTYPKIFGFEVKEIKTDKGVIDLQDLEANAKKGAGFFVTSFAGYYAEQPMKQISEICRNHKCLLIEDATGAIGDPTLCNGNYSDVIVGSFGKWKPVDFHDGGFISANDSEYFEKTKEMYSILRFKPDYEKLLNKLDKAKQRVESFMGTAERIKQDLEKLDLPIFHREKRGLNVIVGFKESRQRETIIEYCKKKKYEFLVCPKDIRVSEDAISIEVKRL